METRRLIVFAGLPGTGKSSLAEAVGRRLGIPVFAKDWLEAALLRSDLGQDEAGRHAVGYAGYELLTTLARRQLSLGQSVILDSVASLERIREQWRRLAMEHDARWIVIECVCTDESLQRQRLEKRQRRIPGWPELEWTEVERVREYYEPWKEDRLVVDTVASLAENMERILSYLQDEPV